MILSLPLSLGVSAMLISLVSAKTDPQLTGTWTTKSRSVITGPVSVALFFARLDALAIIHTVKWESDDAQTQQN